jgi:hypothetical protein
VRIPVIDVLNYEFIKTNWSFLTWAVTKSAPWWHHFVISKWGVFQQISGCDTKRLADLRLMLATSTVSKKCLGRKGRVQEKRAVGMYVTRCSMPDDASSPWPDQLVGLTTDHWPVSSIGDCMLYSCRSAAGNWKPDIVQTSQPFIHTSTIHLTGSIPRRHQCYICHNRLCAAWKTVTWYSFVESKMHDDMAACMTCMSREC